MITAELINSVWCLYDTTTKKYYGYLYPNGDLHICDDTCTTLTHHKANMNAHNRRQYLFDKAR